MTRAALIALLLVACSPQADVSCQPLGATDTCPEMQGCTVTHQGTWTYFVLSGEGTTWECIGATCPYEEIFEYCGLDLSGAQ
jgi:hypothetical protein